MKQLHVGMLIKIFGMLLFGFLLGCIFSFHKFSTNKVSQNIKTPANTWQQYDTAISEENGSFQYSFKYPSPYRVFRSDTSNSSNQELTLSVGQMNETAFTVDIIKSNEASVMRTWSQGYGKTQRITLNGIIWTYFSSQDCLNQQVCVSNDIWFLSGTTTHQVLFHFLNIKELTQFQKEILSTVSLKDIVL